ncbi:RHS repeat-associated core domain-containing protein [Streptomyces sp. NPDC002519]
MPQPLGGQYLPFGGTTDAATSLVNLGLREYDTQTGRFVSRDPQLEATDPSQLTGYDYAANDPVTGSDPTGAISMHVPIPTIRRTGTGTESSAAV